MWLGERGGGSSSRGICVASTSGVRRTKKRFDVIRDGCETRLRCWRQFQNLFTIMPQFRVMHPSLHHSCYRFRRSVALMYKSFFLKKCEPKQKRNGEGQTSPTQLHVPAASGVCAKNAVQSCAPPVLVDCAVRFFAPAPRGDERRRFNVIPVGTFVDAHETPPDSCNGDDERYCANDCNSGCRR